MILSAQNAFADYRYSWQTQAAVWVMVIVLHGLALWLFERPTTVNEQSEEKPLFVSFVAEQTADAAGGTASERNGQAEEPPAQTRSPQPVENKKPVKTLKQSSNIAPVETVTARSLPTAVPIKETVMPAGKPAEKNDDQSSQVKSSGTASTTGNNPKGEGQGEGKNTGGPGNGHGTGNATTGSSGGTLTIPASQLRFRHRQAPRYSSVAQERGYQGAARVLVVVDSSGRTQQVSLSRSSGHDMLDEAALTAARRSTFYPHVVDGQARTVRAVISYSFSFRKAPSRQAEPEGTEEAS